MTTTPDENSTTIELLDCIDDALRNGANMTRANLAFDHLLNRLGHRRGALPTYAKDKRHNDLVDRADESIRRSNFRVKGDVYAAMGGDMKALEDPLVKMMLERLP